MNIETIVLISLGYLIYELGVSALVRLNSEGFRWPPRLWPELALVILVVGTCLFHYIFLTPFLSNRPSLTVDPAEHLYLVGTTALPLPYEDKYEAAAFENSVFSHPLFLEKYLAFASVAAARIYGRISPVNLCYAMYYEVPRENSRDKSPS